MPDTLDFLILMILVQDILKTLLTQTKFVFLTDNFLAI